MKQADPLRPNIAQSKRFEQVACELGCDEDPAHFDEALKKVARHKQPAVHGGEAKNSKKGKSK